MRTAPRSKRNSGGLKLLVLALLVALVFLLLQGSRYYTSRPGVGPSRVRAAEAKVPEVLAARAIELDSSLENKGEMKNLGALHFPHLTDFGGSTSGILASKVKSIDLLPELLSSRNFRLRPECGAEKLEGPWSDLPPLLFMHPVPKGLRTSGSYPAEVRQRYGLDVIVGEQFLMVQYHKLRHLLSDAEKEEANKRFYLWKEAEKNPSGNKGHTGLSWMDVRSSIRRALGDATHWYNNFHIVHPTSSVTSAGIHMCQSFLPIKQLKRAERILTNEELVERVAPQEDRRNFGSLIAKVVDAPLGLGSREEQAVLLQKVEVWSPVCVLRNDPDAATEAEKFNALAMMATRRPSVLCVVLTTSKRIKMGLLQHFLWGFLCDEYLLFVTDGSKGNTPDEREQFSARVRSATTSTPNGPKKPLRGGPRPLDPEKNIIFVKPMYGNAADDSDTRVPDFDADLESPENNPTTVNSWQKLREVLAYLESWPTRTDYDFIYFARDDVYVIPENLQQMLTVDPEIAMLHELGTPLLLGNRMVVPQGKENVAGQIPYVSSSPGFLLNSNAMNLLYLTFNTPECFPNTVADNDDVLLSLCLDQFGIMPRDTSDEIGEDRFVMLNPEWVIRTAVNPRASWWYPFYRPRPMPGAPFAPDSSKTTSFSPKTMEEVMLLSLHGISSSAVSFGYIRTPSYALWIHQQLFG